MANPNLTRIHQKIFSENAANNGQFGSLQTGAKVENPDISVLQALAAYQEGWSDAVISGEELPSLEEFNGLHKIETEQLQYLLNKGVPEYSADAEYYINDIQREVGGTKLYISITDNNIGNALTDIANWEIYYDPDTSIFDNVTINNKLNTQPNAATISGGAITYTGAYMVIDTEGGAATDDLDTINGGNDGDEIRIRSTDNSRKITIKHLTGNIILRPLNDITLDTRNDTITLKYNAATSYWGQVSRTINNDFLNSKAANGYTYLPNGLIMQWGSTNIPASSSQVVTLPIAFTQSNFTNYGTYVGGTNINLAVTIAPVSLSQIEIFNGATFARSIDWQAIGY